jgi:acetyl esterase/lipase
VQGRIIAILCGLLVFFICLTVTTKSQVGYFPPPTAGIPILPQERRSFQGEDIRVFIDIPYAEHKRHMLDVYTPSGVNNTPVLMFVHGGGWSTGCKSMYGHIGRHFAKHGFCTVLVNHRLSPEVKHPEHTIDAARGFAWVKQNINRYGGNPSKISLMGHSSGAHITALLVSDPVYLKSVGHDPREVHSYVGVSGVYKIDLMVTLAGYSHIFNTKDRSDASPVNHVPACPCLLVYGEKDYAAMPRHAHAFRDKIKAHGGEVHEVMAPGETHESIIINACFPEKAYNMAILEFLRK